LLWRRQYIGLAGRFAVSMLLVAVSAPRLAEIFAPVITYASPGVVFDVTFDCNQRFSIDDDLEIDTVGQASGSIVVNWYALQDDCKSLRLSVPVIEVVSTDRDLYRRDTGSTVPALTVTVTGLKIDLAAWSASQTYTGVKITFEPFEFVQPVTFVRAVAQTMVRAYDHPEKKPGETDEEQIKRIRLLDPEFHSRLTLPARFGLIEASVANLKTRALSNGKTKIEYSGSGIIALEDRDHADRKDQFILIYGTLLATGLAMLAEFVCKLAELIAGEGRP